MTNSISSFHVNERTAGGHKGGASATIQAWKTKKAVLATDTNLQQSLTASTSAVSTKATGVGAIEATPVKKEILANLEQAVLTKESFDDVLETAAAYAPTNLDIAQSELGSETYSDSSVQNTAENSGTGYSFSDVIDAVNPLHHLPLVGYIYRGLTGDTLHPASGIIGGGLYGGPIGAMMGTANAISQMQTGKDLGGYALSLAGVGKDTTHVLNSSDDPQTLLNQAAQAGYQPNNLEDISPNAIGFASFSGEVGQAIQTYENVAQGRTAGRMPAAVQKAGYYNKTAYHQADPQLHPPQIDLDHTPKREKITQVSLSPMPAEHRAVNLEI